MKKDVQISNLPDIDGIEKAKVNSILSACADGLQRFMKNDLLLRAHFKEHEHGGARKKYSVHLHLSSAGPEITASSTEWKLLDALQAAVSTLEREAVKKAKG